MDTVSYLAKSVGTGSPLPQNSGSVGSMAAHGVSFWFKFSLKTQHVCSAQSNPYIISPRLVNRVRPADKHPLGLPERCYHF